MSETIAGRLRSAIAGLLDELLVLIRAVPIHPFEREGGGLVFIGFAEYYFGEVTPEQRAVQVTLKRKYDRIAEVIRVLVGAAPEDLLRQWKEADDSLRAWIELGTLHALSANPADNERALRSAGAKIGHILDVLDAMGDKGVLLIPDTNALLDQPNPSAYRAVAGRDDFTIVLLPTVLGEIDDLKRSHRAPEIREAAKKADRWCKGWRAQARQRGGTLLDGVLVDGSITVRAQSVEPDMESTLCWLDPSVPDDRVLAGVLAIEAEHPAARVILVTGDMNMMNKADAAMVETAETP